MSVQRMRYLLAVQIDINLHYMRFKARASFAKSHAAYECSFPFLFSVHMHV